LVADVTVLYLVLLLDTGSVHLRSGLGAHAARSGRQGAPAIDSVAEVCKDGLAGLRSGLHKFRVCAARGSEQDKWENFIVYLHHDMQHCSAATRLTKYSLRYYCS